MNLYQLRDREDHNWGIIDTDAKEEVVTDVWSRIQNGTLTRTEQYIIGIDCEYVEDKLDQLMTLLRASRYDVERVWLTEINPE